MNYNNNNNNDIVTWGARTLYYNGNFDEYHARVEDSTIAETLVDRWGVGDLGLPPYTLS